MYKARSQGQVQRLVVYLSGTSLTKKKKRFLNTDDSSKKSRVVFGPDLVMLEPNEEFTQLSLSGGKPKKPNLIRAIALLLGPDFCSDIIIVETSDHAR